MRREEPMRKTFSSFVSLALMLGLSQCARPAYGQELDEIRRILQGRRRSQSGDIGLAVGIVSERGSQTVSYGKLSRGSDRDVDGDTVFEIGSITKVFTSILLADMVQHGEVSLNDPIAKFLPKSVRFPTKDGKEITLLDLSTHTSGLPRIANQSCAQRPAQSLCRLYS
jgi:serine-type D-Ala-D-Ala carboxypeptidase/endopeptidase